MKPLLAVPMTKENDLGKLAVELDVDDQRNAYWIERGENLW